MIVPRMRQTQADVASHYDELDPIYRALWGDHVHHGLWRSSGESQREAVEALSDEVAKLLDFRHGDRLIDIGCGYGATARRFASRGASVEGFTISAEQLSKAPPAEGVSLHRMDWLYNDLDERSAYGAYSIESSEHMTDKPAFFRQARRVLRDDGRLVVCAWLANADAGAWHVRHLLEPICFEGNLPSLGSKEDYLTMARAEGLACTHFEDVSALVARTWTICAARFVKAMILDKTMRKTVLQARNRRFALSLPRLMLAYRTGAMRYGIFRFEPVASR